MATVTREIEIGAPAPAVWRHISDPEERRTWLGGDLDVDLLPGDRGTFTAPAGTCPVHVDEVEHGRSLTFTWGDEERGASRVTIEVEPDGAGSRVRVTETTEVETRTADEPASSDEADTVVDDEADTVVDDDPPVASALPRHASIVLLPSPAGAEEDAAAEDRDDDAAPEAPYVVVPQALAA